MNENDPIHRFLAWIALFAIVTIIEALKALFSIKTGAIILVSFLIGLSYGGFGNAFGTAGVVLGIIVAFKWIEALNMKRKV